MLYLEILLTVVAWFRGWKWKALFPLAIVVLIGIFVGIGAGASGGTGDLSWLILLDFIVTGALAAMCFVTPKT